MGQSELISLYAFRSVYCRVDHTQTANKLLATAISSRSSPPESSLFANGRFINPFSAHICLHIIVCARLGRRARKLVTSPHLYGAPHRGCSFFCAPYTFIINKDIWSRFSLFLAQNKNNAFAHSQLSLSLQPRAFVCRQSSER